MKIKKLTDNFSVAYQIEPCDIKEIKNLGFKAIICNRPDGEAEGQPDMDDIEIEAQKEGLKFYYIPLANRKDISPQMIEKTQKIISETKGAILAFCRTGTRSTILWALAQSGEMDKNEILSLAKGAGYDIGFIAPLLKS